MNTPDPDRLMHVVLDAESTDEEARELDRLMAADPGLRERFDDLKKFFAQMRRVSDLEPPEELEHTILNEFNARLRASWKNPDDPLNERNAMNKKAINDQDPTVTNQPALPSAHKKKVIVGATLAALALVVAV